MKNIILISLQFFLCFLFLYLHSTAQPRGNWVRLGDHFDNIEGIGVAYGNDPEYPGGCAYQLLHNIGDNTSITFGSITLHPPGTYKNTLLVKYDTSGNAIWAKQVAGPSAPIGVTTDATGNIYLLSYCYDTVSFGPYTLSGSGARYLLARISPSGTIMWTRTGGEGVEVGGHGPSYYALAGGVRTDASGNVYIATFYRKDSTHIGPYTLYNNGSFDLLLAKYDPDGNVIWAQSTGGTNIDYLRTMTVTPSGKLYIAGTFASPSLTFGSTTLTNPTTNAHRIYIAEYDTDGTPLWAESTGKDATPWVNNYAAGLAYDDDENIFLSGTFNDTLFFDGTPVIPPRPNESCAYLIKLDTDHHILWHKTAYVPPPATGTMAKMRNLGLTADDCGNAWLLGDMGQSTSTSFVIVDGHTVNLPPLSNPLPHGVSGAGYIAGFTPTGRYIGACALPSHFDDMNALACAPGGDMYLVSDLARGYMSAGADTVLDTTYRQKAMIVKLHIDTSGCSTGSVNVTDVTTRSGRLKLYPNPTNGTIHLTTQTSGILQVLAIDGRLVASYTITEEDSSLTLPKGLKGLYLCRFTSADGSAHITQRLLIQ